MKIYMLLLSFFIVTASLQAQVEDAEKKSSTGGKTMIKYNIPAAFFKNHVFQLERVVSRKTSLAVTVGIANNASLPFKDNILDQFGDDQQVQDAVESTKFDRFNVSAEYRFYLGRKGAPRGFYLAPFVRYSSMNAVNKYTFNDSDGASHTVDFDGKLTGFGGGLMMGTQWALGRNVVLDWWIFGPFYGSQKGDFHGEDAVPIKDPQGIQDDINNTDLGPWTLTAVVGNQNIGGSQKGVVDAKLSGPFIGIRSGLSLGIRF